MEQFEVLENEEEEIVTDENGEVADFQADVEFDVDTVPGLFVAFDNWLQSPDGGKKDVKTAKQHASQIKRILLVIDSDNKVSSLLDFSLLKRSLSNMLKKSMLLRLSNHILRACNIFTPSYYLKNQKKLQRAVS